ncbi:hypothetical protein BDF20DRAFT_905501 [Mycotypha africana]|uniref:uncharacterized protein n=1 Tax=Mycotypha africana TaxID=64632 RepID=UPI002300C092|nr:uncharacterized protein BDF20DRAFT_905501 [Mycotypha africana]KAI8984767.1 hypothetical protein BDF20DRAFT_905501 [Mycotypha africana]
MKKNWITIYDNTPEARVVYVSESITDHTGWEPEEIIGREAYDLFHPDDHSNIRKLHLVNVYKEKLSTLVSYRLLCKDGSALPIETVLHYCHNVIVTANYEYNEDSLDHKIRVNSVNEMCACLPDGSLQLSGAWIEHEEKLKNPLDSNIIWKDHQIILKQERRFCLILNRFTEDLNIVFVSALAWDLVSLDTQQAIGTSFFDYVQDKDLAILQAQLDLAREHDMVVRLRFDWIIDKQKGYLEPVESVTKKANFESGNSAIDT